MNTAYVLNGLERAITFIPKIHRATVAPAADYIRYDYYCSQMMSASPVMTIIMENAEAQKVQVKVMFNFAQSARIFTCEDADDALRVSRFLQAHYLTFQN